MIAISRPFRWKYLEAGVWVGLVAIVILIAGWFIGPSGTATGVEFSPDLFRHRSFRQHQWCGVAYSKETEEWQSAIDDYLHAEGFVTASSHKARWHFVKGFAPGVRGWHGPAKHMCQAVGCFSGDDRWVQWSKDHPELAKVLWPQVVAWARNEDYTTIAVLFHHTDLKSSTTAEQVRKNIATASEMAGR
jgi:hypothetical protein